MSRTQRAGRSRQSELRRGIRHGLGLPDTPSSRSPSAMPPPLRQEILRCYTSSHPRHHELAVGCHSGWIRMQFITRLPALLRWTIRERLEAHDAAPGTPARFADRVEPQVVPLLAKERKGLAIFGAVPAPVGMEDFAECFGAVTEEKDESGGVSHARLSQFPSSAAMTISSCDFMSLPTCAASVLIPSVFF